MASTLPNPDGCCNPCDEPVSVAVPGPQGDEGADGTNGTNGVNAYTTVTGGAVVMPAEGANVTLAVVNTTWMASQAVPVAGALPIVFIEGRGYLEVQSIPTSTSVILKNIKVTATGAYASNSAPGTAFTAGLRVSPGGLQGPVGAASAGALLAANNLSDVANAATSRTNLGLGTAAVLNTADVFQVGNNLSEGVAATKRTNLGLVIGTNVQAYDATLQSIAALGTAADRIAYTTGVDTWAETPLTAVARTLLDDATASDMRTTLGVSSSRDLLIYQHQLALGTDAGTFTSGAWQTVPLNTEVTDAGNHGSIVGNNITLATGVYRVQWRSYGYAVDRFQSRLLNVTTAATYYGSNSKALAGALSMEVSEGCNRITIAAATEVIRIEAWCETTNVADGFGLANAFGGTEVYASIWLEKES